MSGRNVSWNFDGRSANSDTKSSSGTICFWGFFISVVLAVLFLGGVSLG